MTARFRLPAGRSYNVRTTELARDRQRTEVVCNIFLLDNTVQPFKVNKHDQGQILLDAVFKHLELTERDYFGLHLADDSSDSPRWLDPNKPIRKQLKRGSPHHLNFRVKFFVSDPSKLQEEYTREAENLPGYLSEFCFIPNQPQGFEKEVTKHHQQHSGLTPAQSEFNYLNTARTLELYGVELHYARDQSNTEIFIGVMSVVNLPYCFKIFSLHFCLQHETRDTLLGFNMVNYRACKNLWKACVEHHTFFRLDRPVPPQKNFFAHYLNLGSKNSLFVQEGPRLRPSSMGHLADHVIHASPSLPPNGVVPHDNLVLIKMKPDENGRFGFNVKGGSDQKMPIIVSRVAPGTSADLCVPRLNEGDQVVLINGRDIAEHTHDQVVMFIKASCESHSGELILLVRPNGEPWSDTFKLETEPDFQYIPEKSPTDPSQLDQDAWRDSMLQLKEGLNSATILAQFDQLYRKRPGMTMSCAKLPQNLSKNRYRDISPYDATRVILKGTDDYINANYINMEIPASSLINRYIACQGPLPNTCPDFWQMTWEQGSSLVVMLTTQVERGRVKCHQYWPNPSGSATYGGFQVSCQTEEGNSAFLVRDMTLTHIESGESRELTQIQYLAWPDHGVPDDSTDFLDFVALVRSKRAGKDEPVVVHCSAGIGRTGVLITMETAMCLMECGQPVHPLEIVRTMRDQRAMMIQTPVSPGHLLFFCHCLHRSSIGGLSLAF
uniref:Protein tyrosine phosphatase non-receptor type 4a n=1 Tax=Cyprinus carpio TaxID=7962 RepID=A0A8C1KZ12_CYPCA